MPILHAPTTVQDGIRVQVRFGLTIPDRMRRMQAALAVPQPIIVTGLIDSGTECTCVSPTIIYQLGVGYRKLNLVGLPTANATVAPSLSYDLSVAILHPSGDSKLHLSIPALPVQEVTQLGLFGIDAIIGRDVLASCVMVYDGPAGSVTLAY